MCLSRHTVLELSAGVLTEFHAAGMMKKQRSHPKTRLSRQKRLYYRVVYVVQRVLGLLQSKSRAKKARLKSRCRIKEHLYYRVIYYRVIIVEQRV